MDLNRSRSTFWWPGNKELGNRAVKAIDVEICKWRGFIKALSGAMWFLAFFNLPVLEEENFYPKKMNTIFKVHFQSPINERFSLVCSKCCTDS